MSLETFNINKSNDAYSALKPINWCLNIFALCSVKREKNNLVSNFSPFKAFSWITLLGILNIILLIFKIENLSVIRGGDRASFTDFLQFFYIYSYFEYVVSLYCIYGNKQSCLNYFKIYNSIDRILGVTYVSLTRKLITKSFYFFTIFCIITSIFDYISWSYDSWIPSTIYCADYIYAFLNLLTTIDFISQIVLVEFRLKLVKAFLLIYYSNSNPSLEAVGVLKSAGFIVNLTEIKINKRLSNLRTLHNNDCIDMSSFTTCYLLLLEQIMYLNNAYGVPVLLYSWNILYNIINLINLVIRLFTGVLRPEEIPSQWYLPAITSLIALINYLGVIFTLLYRCEKCYRYVDSLIRLIDLILQNKNILIDARMEFQEFRNLVISRPIVFHAANFFKLDYTLLVSGTTMVITYTIITLQSI